MFECEMDFLLADVYPASLSSLAKSSEVGIFGNVQFSLLRVFTKKYRNPLYFFIFCGILEKNICLRIYIRIFARESCAANDFILAVEKNDRSV